MDHRSVSVFSPSSATARARPGFVTVEGAWFFVVLTVRPKTPGRRYAMLWRSGARVSINLKYLIQIGAHGRAGSRPRIVTRGQSWSGLIARMSL